jgi:hypothetical protein
VLGVAYGSSRDEATAAFAMRSRRSRRDPDFPYSVDDLTWALHQVESVIDNPEADLDTFRVPAEPAALAPPERSGLLSLPAVPLPRRTPRPSDADLATVRSEADLETIDAFLDRRAAAVRAEYVMPFRQAPPIRISARRRRRARLAVAVSAAVIVVAAAATLITVLVLGQAGRDASPTTTLQSTTLPSTTTSTTVAVVDVGPISTLAPDEYSSVKWESVSGIPSEPGTCFSLVEDPAAPSLASASVESCSSPHRYEVIVTFDVGPEIVEYSDVEAHAEAVCAWSFGPYVGTAPSESTFMFSYFVPMESSWPLDRQVICYVFLPDEQLWIGTAQNSGY